jgi:hypothetical protein
MDAVVMSCLERSLIGHKRRFPRDEAPRFPVHGGFGIVFPIEQDSVYQFARTGKWPFQLAE